MFLFQRIKAQDSQYYEWPECAGVAYDPALSAYTNEYSYGPAPSYLSSPSTQQLYYSQDALIGGLQYPPEWKKTPLPKTSPSKSAWPTSFENSHQLHMTENHSPHYHRYIENNKGNSASRSNTYKREMPLEELINSFLQWNQPSQDTGQTKHTMNSNSNHDPLFHNYMLNGGTHVSQPEITSGVNVPQTSHNYKRNVGTNGYSELSAPQQQQSYASPPHHQPQNQHHVGHTPTTNSENSSSMKSFDLQYLINNFMQFMNGQQTQQTSSKQPAESNYHPHTIPTSITLPNQSHSNIQITPHQPYQQTQHQVAHKRTASPQYPVSYPNVEQQHHYESVTPAHHKPAVPTNYPSFSDPNLVYNYDSHMPHDAYTQTLLPDAHKPDITGNPQSNYNSIFNTVPSTNVPQFMQHQINEQASYSSAVSPIEALSNTNLATKHNSPLSHHQAPYTVPNQYHKAQKYNTQTDPLLYNDKSTPSVKQHHKTNTNTQPRNNIHTSQNMQQYSQNLMSQQTTGTSDSAYDYGHHQLTTRSQQPINTQQTPSPSVINNKQSAKNKHSPIHSSQDDLLRNIDIINEFLGKRFNTNKPKQNSQQTINNMNINTRQQNPQKNPLQETLFQQMVDDNFPQILESLAKTPAGSRNSKNQTPKNKGKRNLLQQIISDNLPGIIDSLNNNHPQFQNKNGEIDLRQLQNLLQQ